MNGASPIPATIRDGNFSSIFISVPFSRSLHTQRPYPSQSHAAPSPQTGQFQYQSRQASRRITLFYFFSDCMINRGFIVGDSQSYSTPLPATTSRCSITANGSISVSKPPSFPPEYAFLLLLRLND
ncbi:hypothetical protein ACS0TY_026921 [Phlomoides rotata]